VGMPDAEGMSPGRWPIDSEVASERSTGSGSRERTELRVWIRARWRSVGVAVRRGRDGAGAKCPLAQGMLHGRGIGPGGRTAGWGAEDPRMRWGRSQFSVRPAATACLGDRLRGRKGDIQESRSDCRAEAGRMWRRSGKCAFSLAHRALVGDHIRAAGRRGPRAGSRAARGARRKVQAGCEEDSADFPLEPRVQRGAPARLDIRGGISERRGAIPE
jgi:hypothetical protein